MSRLKKTQAQEMESISSILAFKVFLLEKEVGYQVTGNMNGIMVMERMKMMDRYWEEQQRAQDKSNNKKTTTPSKLLKR